MSGLNVSGYGYGANDKSNATSNKDKAPTLALRQIQIWSKNGTEIKVTPGIEENKDYYRYWFFGDIASKPEEYDNQAQPSVLKPITQATKDYVEDVYVEVSANESAPENDRDLQAYDIDAKPAGVGGFSVMKGSDAYMVFLEVNADDFTVHQNKYGEDVSYYDEAKSDGRLKVFSSELVDGKEYLAIRDNAGMVRYFDPADGLKEVKLFYYLG